MGREHRNPAEEDVVHLFFGLTHRRRGGDDLRPDRLAVDRPSRKFVNGGFVQADHGSQRSADQMKFVLDDQIRGTNGKNLFDLDRIQ